MLALLSAKLGFNNIELNKKITALQNTTKKSDCSDLTIATEVGEVDLWEDDEAIVNNIPESKKDNGTIIYSNKPDKDTDTFFEEDVVINNRNPNEDEYYPENEQDENIPVQQPEDNTQNPQPPIKEDSDDTNEDTQIVNPQFPDTNVKDEDLIPDVNIPDDNNESLATVKVTFKI